MKRARLSFLYVLLVLLLSVNLIAIVKRQWVGDWLALRNYAPSAEVAALADRSTMTDKARHLFYINHPSLEDKAGFNQHCSSKTEHSVVLGCFHGDRLGIYIYNVQDDRLEGVEEVTAAHEMLHQAYSRLDDKEKARINALLRDFADEGNFEQRIKDKLQLYQDDEPANLPNEMHSIFATEIRNLPAKLEAYYARYFTNRLQLVGLSERYQGEFAARKAKVDRYDAQLSDLNDRIEQNKSEIEERQRALTKLRAEVEGFASRGDRAAYQSGASQYNAQVTAYNGLVDSTQQLIAQYNAIVAERNAISTEEQQLQKALDSRIEEPDART